MQRKARVVKARGTASAGRGANSGAADKQFGYGLEVKRKMDKARENGYLFYLPCKGTYRHLGEIVVTKKLPRPRKAMHLQAENVALVMVTYRNIADTLRCLESVYAMHFRPKYIVVVENGSDPALALEMFCAWQALAAQRKEEEPCLAYAGDAIRSCSVMLRVERNNGYACGCNAGLRAVMSNEDIQAVWLLNNDTLVAPNALEALCARLNMRPDAGMAVSLLADIDSRETLLCVGGGSFSSRTGVTRDLGRGMALHSAMSCPAERFERGMDYACGASLLLRRSTLETMGYMDERYYLYYEDVEYSLRSRRNGLAFAVAGRSVVYHKAGATTAADPHIDFYATRNRLDCVRRYAFRNLPFALLHIVCGIGKSLLFGKSASSLSRLRGVKAFFSGEWGRA